MVFLGLSGFHSTWINSSLFSELHFLHHLWEEYQERWEERRLTTARLIPGCHNDIVLRVLHRRATWIFHWLFAKPISRSDTIQSYLRNLGTTIFILQPSQTSWETHVYLGLFLSPSMATILLIYIFSQFSLLVSKTQSWHCTACSLLYCRASSSSVSRMQTEEWRREKHF